MQKSSLIISNFATGYETDREPFLINNDAFPVLNNAYVWRGRVKKKRGTSFLGRLQRTVSTTGVSTYNLITDLGLGSNASIVPGSVTLIGALGATWTDPNADGKLYDPISMQFADINYATGVYTIVGVPLSGGTLDYYPNLPVMGLEDFDVGRINFPDMVAFDTKYSYQFNQSTRLFYDVTFYKASGLPFTWTGADYQQFWTTNYQGAMWTTNGVAGFHFATITLFADITTSTTAVITLDNSNLVNGDVLFFYEIQAASNTINGVNGIITDDSLAPIYTVTFTEPQTVTTWTSGIVQLLTDNRSATGNGIKFYDGDPTNNLSLGWVNFAPPLSNLTQPQYLIGADIIVPFKNRLLFFGVTIATSAAPGGVFYANRMVYSENGTAYYNALVPLNQTYNNSAWFQNVAGFGGFLTAPIPQSFVTLDENEDVLLVGFESKQAKLISTGDDTFPFFFQTISSELGSQSTFSGISLDTGALTIGDYGIALTTQISTQRIDLVIPDAVFDISSLEHGSERVTAIRDFRNEFVYFTYPPKNRPLNIFNSKTLLYNYRDNTWATFDENFTRYGTFRFSSNLTWAKLNTRYSNWLSWTDPWNFGGTGERYPNIAGGNQQGFVLLKDTETTESKSQYIKALDVNTLIVTSPNHCLQTGDYIEILEVLGVTNINNQIFDIRVFTIDTFLLLSNSEQINNPPAGSYIGAGVYRRITNINVQSKQFPIFWEGGLKTRIGTQRYLIDNAPGGEITANIFTSQNTDFPSSDPQFDYLIYSNILLTRPEPNKPFQISQNQIWHRMSNSFNGDSVQIQFSLSDSQMRNNTINSAEIVIQSIAFDIYPGALLA